MLSGRVHEVGGELGVMNKVIGKVLGGGSVIVGGNNLRPAPQGPEGGAAPPRR